MGQYMFGALEKIKSNHPSIGNVRGIGLMLGVDFVTDRGSRNPNIEFHNKMERFAFEHGLITLGCGKSAIRFTPPLSISKHEIDEGLSIFDYVVKLAENEYQPPLVME